MKRRVFNDASAVVEMCIRDRYYQIKLPLDLEISIPSDDPVRLVSAFVEEMDLSELRHAERDVWE